MIVKDCDEPSLQHYPTMGASKVSRIPDTRLTQQARRCAVWANQRGAGGRWEVVGMVSAKRWWLPVS